MSGKALREQAETQYKIVMDLAKAEWIVETYRSTYSKVKSLWYGIENAAVQAVLMGGIHSYNGIRYEVINDAAGCWLRCTLPNGRFIWYFDPEVNWEMMPWDKEKQCLSYQGRDNKNNGVWGRVRTYGGMLTENCLTGETEVLTNRGWLTILNVQPVDLLWDGIQWVEHDGLVFQGNKKVIDFGGVNMTSDHKVLIDEEWKSASDCSHDRATTTCETLRRSQVWKTKSDSIFGIKLKTGIYLAMFMRLWKRKESHASRFKSWGRNCLRVRLTGEKKIGWKDSKNPRNVQASSILCLEINDRSLQVSNSPIVEELWGAWNSSLFSMESFRKVLGGYGSNIYKRFTTRKSRQQCRILYKKLQMGNKGGTIKKSKNECVYKNTQRSNDSIRSKSNFWSEDINITLENKKQMASGKAVPVYDILNAGPLIDLQYGVKINNLS